MTSTCRAIVAGLVLVCLAAGPAAAAPINLAPGGVASASSEHGLGLLASRANDGNRAGNDNSLIFHTATDTAAWWEVDLGDDYHLDRVEVFPRTNVTQLSVENFQIDVFDSGGANVFSDTYHPTTSTGDRPWGTSELRGAVGQRVRISRLDGDPNFMTFAEFEVWGQTTPIGTNIAFGGLATAINERPDSVAANAIDGDINGHWGQADTTGIGNPGNSVYHSADNVVGNWWQVDLGSVRSLDYANVFGRVDTTVNASDVTLDVLADDGTTVAFTQNLLLVGTDLGGQRYDQTVDFGGTDGRFVRITSNQGGANFALALGEVEVFEVADTGGGLSLDLADMVGGGDGTGTGGNQGVSTVAGLAAAAHRPDVNGGPVNVFHPSTDNPLVDGVAVPDGGAGPVPVSSTGLTVSGISDTNGASYDEIWNGHNVNVSGGPIFASRIGMHASKLVTFDLDAIEAANPGMIVTEFDGVSTLSNAAGSVDFYVVVDGQIVDSTSLDGQAIQALSASISPDDRFLTLITSSRGLDGSDWSLFGNPTLTLELIPEPGSLSLLAVAATALAVWSGRRRRAA